MTTPTGQLALKDIAGLADVSRAAVSNWRARHGDFPQPIAGSPERRPLFDLEEVIAWLKSKDVLPQGADEKQAELALTSATNALRSARIDPVSATTLALYVLAVRKHSESTGDNSAWQKVSTSATASDLISALEQSPVPSGPASEPMLSWQQIVGNLSDESVVNLLAGLGQADSSDYRTAAEIIVDAFLGLGGRGDVSAYGSSNSMSSKLLSAAAATSASEGETVFDPACGIGGTLIDLAKKVRGLALVGADIDPVPVAIARLYAYLGDVNATFASADSLARDPYPDTTFDTVVSEPPFGMRVAQDDAAKLVAASGLSIPTPRFSEDAFLLYASTHLSAGGRGYILTPVGTGFRRDLAQLRQTLVAQGSIEAVIQLPAGLLSYTRVSTLLWVLRGPQVAPGTSVLIADATKAHAAETDITKWLEDIRAGRETSIPTRRLELAELITLNGEITPSALQREGPDSDEVAASLRACLAQLEKSIGRIQKVQTTSFRSLATPPAAEQSVSLQKLIDTGAIKVNRGLHRSRTDSTSHNGVEAYLMPLRDKGEPPETVTAPRSTHWLRSGDVIVPIVGTLPARVFTDDGHKWVAPEMAWVLSVKDPEITPTFLAACINASFNKPADLGTGFSRRSLKHIEIPVLDPESQQQVTDALVQLEHARKAADDLAHRAEATTDAILNVVRFGDTAN